MLKINSTKDQTAVTAVGDIGTVVADFAAAIGSMYSQIAAQDQNAAKAFRRMIVQAVADPDSPTWSLSIQAPNCAMVRDQKQGFSVPDIIAAPEPTDEELGWPEPMVTVTWPTGYVTMTLAAYKKLPARKRKLFNDLGGMS